MSTATATPLFDECQINVDATFSTDRLERLDVDQLRVLHAQYHRAADLLWHAVANRVARLPIPSYTEIEAKLVAAADPATMAAFDRELSEEEAHSAVHRALLLPGWSWGHDPYAGAVRIATGLLISEEGWRKDRIVAPMLRVADVLCGDHSNALSAVVNGIADAVGGVTDVAV